MYSQYHEDEVIAEYLVKKKIMVEPLIVDVGAGDGEFISNSKYIIEKYPYKALLIEPNDQPFRLLKKFYKDNNRVEVLQTAVAGRVFPYKLTQKLGSHWSTAQVRKSNAKGAKETETLSNILEARGISKIGILSLDTEGLDTEIVAELLRNTKIRPEVIIIESKDDKDALEQEEILALEYRRFGKFGVNQIFILKTSDKK